MTGTPETVEVSEGIYAYIKPDGTALPARTAAEPDLRAGHGPARPARLEAPRA